MNKWTLCLLITLTGLFCAPVGAQDEASAPDPITVSDPDISNEALTFLLLPLPQDQLIAEADGWLKVLQEQVQAISDKQIEALEIEGEARSKVLEEINEMRDEQVRMADRVGAVVAELRAKGGEVEIYEAYLSAVSGPKVDLTDGQAALMAAVGWLKSPEGGLRWAKNIALFIATLIAFRILAAILGRATKNAVSRVESASDLLKDFLVNVVRKLTFFIGIVVALAMLEVEVGPLLAAMGATGFIVGFALQGTLSNFAAGLMILLYRPYDIGDYVDIGGTAGTVSAMNLVSTTLLLPDNQVVVVPNNSIWGGIITNVTGSDTRRVDLVFGIGYDDDIEKTQRVLQEVVSAHPKVLAEPELNIQVHELADSSVNFIVRPWVKTEDYWTVYWDLMRTVKQRFDAESISIPYPQQDVYIHHASSGESAPAKSGQTARGPEAREGDFAADSPTENDS